MEFGKNFSQENLCKLCISSRTKEFRKGLSQ